MSTESYPTRIGYFKTYQASFQIIELVLLLLIFTLIFSQPLFLFPAMIFAVVVFVMIWLVTILYFTCYITGSCCETSTNDVENSQSRPESSAESTGLLKETPMRYGSYWTEIEYIVYIVITPLLVAAVIIVTIHLSNTIFLVAMIFGWLAIFCFTVHMCALVQRSKGDWPHVIILNSVRNTKNPSGESETATSGGP